MQQHTGQLLQGLGIDLDQRAVQLDADLEFAEVAGLIVRFLDENVDITPSVGLVSGGMVRGGM